MIKNVFIKDIVQFFQERDPNSNKGDFGKVGIIGGSLNYSGAVKLANMSLTALKSGCGLIKIIVPSSIINLVAPNILEQTLYPYNNLEDIKKSINDLNTIAIGMGWGSDKNHLEILQYIIENFGGSIVLDADGINTLQQHLEILKKSRANIVLTPHLKEFSRLIEQPISYINENKISLAISFAQTYHVTLLLKGSTTIVTDGNQVYQIKYGTPGMATSGSGDVLSGILAGLLAYHEFNLLIISAGAILNGVAGELACEKYTDIAMLAHNTVECIPEAIKKIRKEGENVNRKS